MTHRQRAKRAEEPTPCLNNGRIKRDKHPTRNDKQNDNTMFEYSKDGVTIALWLDNRRERSDGRYPLKVRVTYARQRAYYPTGKHFTPKEWEALPRTRSRASTDTRRDIENSYNHIRTIAEDLAHAGAFTLDALNIRLRGASSTTINEAFRAKIDELSHRGNIGNMDNYKCVLNSIEQFAGTRIPFNAVTTSWVERYADHLRREGKAQATIAIRLRTLRAILNNAMAVGIIRPADYPFGRGKYEIRSGAGRKMALSIEQIGQIARYTDDKSVANIRYRDYWMFLYLCNGINVADFIQLRYSDIIGGEIYYKRQKTLNTSRTLKDIRVVVTQPMRDIIQRWGNPPHPDNYIFPHLRGNETPLELKRRTQYLTRLINRAMAHIAEALGIDHISTYTARHSFATVLKRSGANIAYISESLGHSSQRTTENYLSSFEREERERNAELLTKF